LKQKKNEFKIFYDVAAYIFKHLDSWWEIH